MESTIWSKLKSGTDIRGVASEGVEGEHINLTDEVARQIASAFILWLSKRSGKPANELKIAVGHDSRISAQRIKAAVLKAALNAGATAYDCGLSSTPAMFMSTLDLQLEGSVQITASHHPFNRNGLKFFTPQGGLESEDISEILTYCEQNQLPERAEGGTVIQLDYMAQYAEQLRDIIKKGVNAPDFEQPLKGFKIIVDAGNGAGGFYASEVLAPLGADTSGSQFLEPDGTFPNHIPNPENAEAMASVCAATLKAGADLGVIFDTDVDRSSVVDSKGEAISRNRLVALASAIALEGNEGGTIVTDSITSAGLKIFIENYLGGKHFRYKRGYRNVINQALLLNSQGINTPLAIETSGHAALRENYFLDDGAYLVTKIIIKMAKLRQEGGSLSALIADLAEPAEEREIRLKIEEEDFVSYGNSVIAGLESYAKKQQGWQIAEDNREGIRVLLDKAHGNGWFLLRLSVHDPIMPLNIESDSKGGVDVIEKQVMSYLAGDLDNR
ncbi:MAG: phosphomannomutase/phosphoglucomutase [Oscillospiraceae bacterium]|nr:phosphomannomutase/phosphoglucomutase [Oscillospiraceae bacterium]